MGMDLKLAHEGQDLALDLLLPLPTLLMLVVLPPGQLDQLDMAG